MELIFIVAGLWIYSLVASYLFGASVENVKLNWGNAPLNARFTVFFIALAWPITLLWAKFGGV